MMQKIQGDNCDEQFSGGLEVIKPRTQVEELPYRETGAVHLL